MIPVWKRIHRGRKQREQGDGLLHSQTGSLASVILEQPPCSVKNNQLFIWLTRQTGALREYYLSGVCSTTRQTENTLTQYKYIYIHTHTDVQTHTSTHRQIKKEQKEPGMQVLHGGGWSDIFTKHLAIFLLYSVTQTCCFMLCFDHHCLSQQSLCKMRQKSDIWQCDTIVAGLKIKPIAVVKSGSHPRINMFS